MSTAAEASFWCEVFGSAVGVGLMVGVLVSIFNSWRI